jgi:CheY-like chemotaxis protein/glycine cleavage system H lipoate-binding protein
MSEDPMRKMNILVVDDEQIVLDSVKKHFRKENYEVYAALSARAGLGTMDETTIDIVLTDLMMPDIDGLEFMKMVSERNPKTPVIMITGYATINTALQATQQGAFDYVAKPFAKAELQGVVRRAAELVQAAESNAGPRVEEPKDDKITATKKLSPAKITFKGIGEHSWITLEEDGTVLIGVEYSFLSGIGGIQTIHLPAEGDELRQGGVYLQIFSTDLRSHVILSPLSGTVIAVNENVRNNPEIAKEDTYESGWLVLLKPTRF